MGRRHTFDDWLTLGPLRRFLSWLRERVNRRLALPPARRRSQWGDQVSMLPADLQEALDGLSISRGAVHDIVSRAVEDFGHLKAIVLGPASREVDGHGILVEAEVTLRTLVSRAAAVAAVAEVASRRKGDRPGREAAGEAVLRLRDLGGALHSAASAAIQLAASHTESDVAALTQCVERLHLLAEATHEVNEYLS